VDVYSFAICAWELLMQQRAHAELKQRLPHYKVAKAVAREGLRPRVPSRWPRQLSALVTACWDADPAERPTFRVIVGELERFQKALHASKWMRRSLRVPRTWGECSRDVVDRLAERSLKLLAVCGGKPQQKAAGEESVVAAHANSPEVHC
jgi:hypothetical protein